MAPTKAEKKKEEAEALAKKKKDAEALEKKKKEAGEALAKKKKDEEEALATQKKAENVEGEPIGNAASSSGRADADEGLGANGEQAVEEPTAKDKCAEAAASSVEPETTDNNQKDSEKENPKKESMLQVSLCNICSIDDRFHCQELEALDQLKSILIHIS